MKQPRFELRFSNGDVFLTNEQDHQLLTSAIVVLDHVTKNVVKNRHGPLTEATYRRLTGFDAEASKELAEVRSALNAKTPLDAHLPIVTRINGLFEKFIGLSQMYANLQRAYKEETGT